MLTVEIKVNGSLVAHVYARNIAPIPSGKYRYEFEFYETETRKVRNGCVEHRREDGIVSLVNTILSEMPSE